MSGGQWQRILLTRAFYRRASLLVMDELTAALDARAEHRVFTGLRGQQRTTGQGLAARWRVSGHPRGRHRPCSVSR